MFSLNQQDGQNNSRQIHLNEARFLKARSHLHENIYKFVSCMNCGSKLRSKSLYLDVKKMINMTLLLSRVILTWLVSQVSDPRLCSVLSKIGYSKMSELHKLNNDLILGMHRYVIQYTDRCTYFRLRRIKVGVESKTQHFCECFDEASTCIKAPVSKRHLVSCYEWF